jgi:ABC-type dipeptide/oligopeptide/nickel transport system permease subunit
VLVVLVAISIPLSIGLFLVILSFSYLGTWLRDYRRAKIE